MASRHLSRIAALQALFASDIVLAGSAPLSADMLLEAREKNIDSLAHDDEDKKFTEALLKGVAAKQSELDGVLEKAAPQWPINKIAAIDRNILRIGLYELLFGATVSVPPKVALNEAIELAKTFGGDTSPKFVNGVLGSVYRSLGSPRKEEAPKENDEIGYSAGVVVCAKIGDDEWAVALVLDAFDTWTVPKSKVKEGELSKDAALRAASEELGLTQVELCATIGEHTYDAHTPAQGRTKRVVGYFVGCTEKAPLAPVKKRSVKDARWFPLHELAEAQVYDDLRPVIESGIEAVRAKEEDEH